MNKLKSVMQEFDDKKEFSIFHVVNAANEVNLTLRKSMEGYEIKDVNDTARAILKTALAALED
ncbi:hypothetical protein [Xenorhabdus bovienii]|uniref:hypothetical protein n=1 Tax=Xenorhabdus bovienii TaxID=40576 RepID=UPI0023B2D26A|nr:hypothetical protein [Xenorhabdus bovienii]MDE9429067.1 hypothetical protein [Xenorhabdus bovienii]MDE9538835.1 hypothetical protein [Xenorhabdus bovienii]